MLAAVSPRRRPTPPPLSEDPYLPRPRCKHLPAGHWPTGTLCMGHQGAHRPPRPFTKPPLPVFGDADRSWNQPYRQLTITAPRLRRAVPADAAGSKAQRFGIFTITIRLWAGGRGSGRGLVPSSRLAEVGLGPPTTPPNRALLKKADWRWRGCHHESATAQRAGGRQTTPRQTQAWRRLGPMRRAGRGFFRYRSTRQLSRPGSSAACRGFGGKGIGFDFGGTTGLAAPHNGVDDRVGWGGPKVVIDAPRPAMFEKNRGP